MGESHAGNSKEKELLRSAGMKVTPLRLQILGELIDAARPLSHAELTALMPDLDRVTLYRSLTTFVEKDIAHQVQGIDGLWRFCAHADDGHGCPGNHPHFLCTVCGTMTCLTDQRLPRVDVPNECCVDGKQLVAYGVCSQCSKEAPRGRESIA